MIGQTRVMKSRHRLGRELLLVGALVSCATGPSLLEEEPFVEPAFAWTPREYVCYRAGSAIQVDGRLDEEDWQNAPWTEDFRDIEGDSRPIPRFRTRAKMLWDDEFFYVAAWLEEPHLFATLTERDSVIFYDHDFEVFLDPDGDTHQYYELEVNALGTEWDLFLVKPYRDGGPALHAWDIPGLQTGVALQGTLNDPSDVDESWTVEIAFPWAALTEATRAACPPAPGDQWAVDFSRVEWRTEVEGAGYRKQLDPSTGKPYPEDNWVWSPTGLINMHYPELWGQVQFSANVAGGVPEAFQARDREERWFLRQLDYAQRKHVGRTGRYSNRVAALGLPTLPTSASRVNLETHSRGYSATMEMRDGSIYWIREDGRLVHETREAEETSE